MTRQRAAFWTILGAAAAAAAAGGLFFALRGGAGEPPPPPKAPTAQATSRPARRQIPDAKRTRAERPNADRKTAGAGRRRFVDPTESFSEKDRALYNAVQDALDAEDYERTRAAAEAACRSANPDVRLQAVDALSWFGEKALADLTPLMADADEDVAQAAVNAWEMALVDVEDNAFKLTASRMAMKVIRDSQTLVSIGAQFVAAATEMIESAADEKAANAIREQAVRTLAEIIRDAGPESLRADAAKGLYEDLTGNDWDAEGGESE